MSEAEGLRRDCRDAVGEREEGEWFARCGCEAGDGTAQMMEGGVGGVGDSER